jgi:hypothetical protein
MRRTVVRISLSVLVGLIFLPSAQANKSRIKDKIELKQAINKAQQKSYEDELTLRNQVNSLNEERINSYTDDDYDFEYQEAQRVRPAKKTTLKAADLGEPDYHYEEVGEDHSGLNSLRSEIYDENEFVDIDKELKELREISSLTN